jgi:hypothetical protein
VTRGPNHDAKPVAISEFSEIVRDFERGYIAAVAFPELNALPSVGSGSFLGKLAFDFAGDSRGTAVADLNLQVDFGSGRVAGSASNFAIAQNDEPPTSVSGSLGVSGGTQGGLLAARLNGSLSGPPQGTYRDLEVAAKLRGSFRGLNGQPDRVAGTVEGDFGGSSNLEITAGAFYGDLQR